MGERELIGSGKVAEVFAQGEHVLKLYRAADAKPEVLREAAILASIEPLGLPVPAVIDVGRYDDRWGLVMTRVAGRPFLDVMMSDAATVPAHIDAMVSLHERIHSHSVRTLPSHKAKLAAAIRRTASLSEALRARLLETLAALPAGERLCHLDFHPANILGEPGNAMVVDWLDASLGDPAADVCRSHVIIHPHAPAMADAYLAAYTAASGVDPAEIQAWRPVIAGARLAEGVPETDYLVALAEAT
jgi:aminoglycoside phosphotransferase (APT) family kinase protein